jgi:hypothetical protein
MFQMSRFRVHIIPFLLGILGFGLLQQSGDASQTAHDYLGFSLIPGSNSSLVSFYLVRKYEDPAKSNEFTNISEASFLNIALGWGESSANPNKENLFTKYDVSNCGYKGDTVIKHMIVKGGFFCDPLADIWRLRYSEWPYAFQPPRQKNQQPSVNNPVGPGPGWAREKLNPSEGQQEILKGYGPNDFYEDVIFGEKAFQLLHDIQDANWVGRYKSS